MPEEQNNQISDAQAIIDTVERLYPDNTFRVEGVGEASKQTPLFAMSEGRKIVDLTPFIEKFNGHPARATGNSVHATEDSFVEHVNRFKTNPNTVLFANALKPSIKAVYNYHGPSIIVSTSDGEVTTGKPGFKDHTAVYAPDHSNEWLVWSKHNEQSMSQDQLGQFIEDNAFDLAPDVSDLSPTLSDIARVINTSYATADEVIEMSRNFKVHEIVSIRESRISATGDQMVEYNSKSGDDASTAKFRGLFIINIPVFAKGPIHTMAVRIRYRKKQGDNGAQGHSWNYSIYRMKQNLDAAYVEILERIKTNTNVPMFVGEA